MLGLFIFATSLAVALARTSPNADLVEELLKSPEGSRYSSNVLEDAFLDVPGLISKYGYPVEVHTVTTQDGYILEMHRIPHGRDQNNQPDLRKPVVFLMHGLLSSSADYVIMGPGNALAYRLAEEGYDVWMGNARGNYYSRQHISLDPNEKVNQDFWKFSWDEIGHIDLAAFVDHILIRTGQSKIHYVGHSQGGTAFLVLASLRPEYNEKFISFQGLAPASFFNNNVYSPFLFLAPFERILVSAAFQVGLGEFLGNNRELFRWLGINVCSDEAFLQPLCISLPFLGTELKYINTTMFPAHLGHSPAGAAIRQIAHYGQLINSHEFRRYDHGLAGNLINYSQFRPPAYDLKRITTPAYLHYTLADNLVHYLDVYHLAESLGNTVGLYQVSRPTFTHVDFIWAVDAKDIFHDQLLDTMRDAERRDFERL